MKVPTGTILSTANGVVRYPSLLPIPSFAAGNKSLMVILSIAAATAALKTFRLHRLTQWALPILFTLLCIQEFRLESLLIEDFTSYTGGKIYNNMVHYLQSSPESNENRRSIQLFHGFGANSLSFLNTISSFKEKAHIISTDLIGFGFNLRRNLDSCSDAVFSPLYNAQTSNAIADSHVAAEEYFIIGHSMGCVPAVIAAALRARSGQRVTLILEAPAFPLSPMTTCTTPLDAASATAMLQTLREPPIAPLKPTFFLLAPLQALCCGLLRLIIRRATHLRCFWRSGLQAAFFKADNILVPGYIGYSLPSQAKGFDHNFLRFVSSQFGSRMALSFASGFVASGLTVMDTLRCLVALGAKVVLVHGVHDKIVPLQCSRRIVSAISGIELIKLNDCGHIPHEEVPETFGTIIDQVMHQTTGHD